MRLRARLPLVLVALLLLSGVSLPAGAEEWINTRVAKVEPFPRFVARGKTLELRGTLKKGHRAPEVILIGPRYGKTYLNRRDLMVVLENKFNCEVRFEEGVGIYRLELIASNKSATRSALRVDVHYGGTGPIKPRFLESLPEGSDLPRTLHAKLIEKRFLERLNAFRRKLKLKPVRWNEEVGTQARRHAARMAKSHRLLHRFGGRDIQVRLAQEGGVFDNGDVWGGWTNCTSERPFPRVKPEPPPGIVNRTVVFVLREDSLERLFQQYFVRQAAFRICAADPLCEEVAVGVIWGKPPPPKTPSEKDPKKQKQKLKDALRKLESKSTARKRAAAPRSATAYFAICFVQTNDITLLRRRSKVFREVVKRAESGGPDDLRRLGRWSRDRNKSRRILERALRSPKDRIRGGAFDGLLLLDEEFARSDLIQREARTRKLLEKKRYGDAAALWRGFRYVRYDVAIAQLAKKRRTACEAAAEEELKEVRKQAGPDQERKLQALLRRCGGLAAADLVRTELSG